jgi:hypothetical protein
VTIDDGVVALAGEQDRHPVPGANSAHLTTQVVASGYAVGDFSSLDANAHPSRRHRDRPRDVIGAGALIMRSTRNDEVYVGTRTEPSDARSCETEL